MAGEKNFNVKNGLSVGGVEVINSSGDLVAGGVGTAVQEAIADKIGGIIQGSGSTTVTYDDAADTITISSTGKTTEEIQDIVGGMVSSNTESGITVAYEDGDGTIDFTVGTLNQNTTGSAATLTTARTIGGVSFDGSANINLPGVNTSGTVDTSGNAATATALETARTIHGVSFDGSANIDLAETIQDTVGAMVGSNTETGIAVTYEDSDGTLDFVVGTLNQDTTGNAATATALETARTIHGVSFDGTGNIDLTEVVQDTVGAMFTGNTETNIAATYEDGDGTIDLVVGDTTGNAATATALETARAIAVAGDVVGTANFDGSAGISINTTIQANSVALGTDTTGNFMTDVSAGTGVAVSHTAGEGSTATISIGQAVSTSSDVTFGDIAATDLTLAGNLTVNGTTTTASSTNTVIADTLIELGNGTSGTPANDSGFVIERGSSDNAFIGFDESADKFKMGTGSFTGASTGNLTISTGTLVANLEGNVTGNVTGNTSGTAGGLSGTPNISVGTIASGAITITNATNAGGTARNVYQSTSAPGGSDGAVGDLWVLYS
jgi:hypothetical protein